ncbi:hypothetical protein [Brevundimonas vesicularis]
MTTPRVTPITGIATILTGPITGTAMTILMVWGDIIIIRWIQGTGATLSG